MAVPVQLRNLPEYLRSAQFSYDASVADAKGIVPHELLQFPKSACALWDGTSIGSPVFLHVAQNRKPRLQLLEKLLWLIHKQVDSDGTASKLLVGSLSVDEDMDGVSFKVDRLDTRQTDLNASLLQDDVQIPVQITNGNIQDRNQGSVESYAESIKLLQKRCSSPEALELNGQMVVRGWCTVRAQPQGQSAVAHLQFDLVTPGNVFKATPVHPVPIIPSALAKNLAGPRNLSHMQGRPKMGYLTMDATRKLLLVLESDPKVASLAVVGIWVSGVSLVHHPFVWASCLRYLHNERLQDRVCMPPEGFLLVVYSFLHSKPEFYEINATSGKSDLQFDLYTGYEVTTLSKKSSGSEPGILEWELSPVRNGPKREMFDAALEDVKSQSRQEAESTRARPSISVIEDIMPRTTPAPHQSKTMTIRPMVPELSLIWNDNNPFPYMQPYPSSPTCLNTAFSGPCSAPLSLTSPATSERQGIGFVPPSCHTGPTAGSILTASDAGSCVRDHQNSECIPRKAFPTHHPVSEQNNGAGTCLASLASSGAYSSCMPQSGTPLTLHYNPNQAGSESSSVAVHSSHGAALYQFAAHSQQHRHLHNAFHPQPQLQIQPQFQLQTHPQFQQQLQMQPQVQLQPQLEMQPQPQPRPRLMPASGVHFCRPNLAGPAVRPAQFFPQPVQPQRPAHAVPRPQSASSHGQHLQNGVPVSFSQLNTHCPSLLHQWLEGRPLPVAHAMMRTDCPSSIQKSAPAQIPLHHPAGTTVQAQCQPPPRTTGSVGTSPWQQEHQASNIFPKQTGLPSLHPSSIPYAHNPSGKVHMSCSGAEECEDFGVDSAPPPGPQSLAHTGNDSQPLDSTSGSGKSSDDSGLSVTPDRSSSSPKLCGGPSGLSLQSVNWAGVPAEVVQLLCQQDAQLRTLQAQIQQLLTLQQQQQQPALSFAPSDTASTPTPAPSSGQSTPSTLKRETCSTAVNTTLLDPGSPLGGLGQATNCVSIQTSPCKPLPAVSPIRAPPLHPDFYPHPNRQSPSSPAYGADNPSIQRHLVDTKDSPWQQEGPSTGDMPAAMHHQGLVPLSSTEHEDDPSGRSTSQQSSDSPEQPSPVRSLESHMQLSNSTPSPLSASMCVRQDEMDEESGAQEVSPDSKEYYDQLINNIRLFLNSHSQEADSTEGDKSDTVNATEATDTSLIVLDSALEAVSLSLPACPGGVNTTTSSSTTLMPHINYLSMMLAWDPDASLELNAMAMKYLRDEQLTQVARHHQSPAQRRAGSSHLLLRQALAASLDTTSASDVSRLGMSATNLSMATRKYLEKHGLLGGDGDGESMLDINHTIRLQTDFSLALMSSSHGGSSSSLPSSPQKATPSTHSPVKREMLRPAFKLSPAIAEEKVNLRTDSNRRQLGDLGASPALRLPRCYNRDCSPEETPIFPERYHGTQQQGLVSDCSVATEDDRILDIEKLKQLPKLL